MKQAAAFFPEETRRAMRANAKLADEHVAQASFWLEKGYEELVGVSGEAARREIETPIFGDALNNCHKYEGNPPAADLAQIVIKHGPRVARTVRRDRKTDR